MFYLTDTLMTDLFIEEMYTPQVLALNKTQMCRIINTVRGYAMTPDSFTKKELINYLIDGGCYSSWLRGKTHTEVI